MKPHLELAKQYWKDHLNPADTAIDATCGNGKDTMTLLDLLPEGQVIAIDIQNEAISRCKEIILSDRVTFLHQSHATLPPIKGVRLVVYNLGYLPGGDKKVTTMAETTIASLIEASSLIAPGGALSIMCYPGHEEGAKEEQKVTEWAETLDSNQWKKNYYTWRNKSPTLLWIKHLGCVNPLF